MPMKKNLLTLAALVFTGALTIKAQNNNIQPCNTFAAMEAVFANDPSAKVRYDKEQAELKAAYEAYSQSLSLHKVNAAVQYTIPVVFHVMHLNGAENISDAALISALAQVNSDYAKAGADVGTINATYAPLYINSDIKMMLAHQDPLGNCTNGIVHHYDTNTDWAQNSYPYPYTWAPNKYLNIYIVRQICSTLASCSPTSVIVGYTYKPGTWGTGAAQDAIVYNYQFLSGTAARSLSHEIGHWLNLSHTFGNTNNPGVTCGDDGLSDTPVTKGYFSTCPGGNAGPFTGCSASENIENIMDYSSCPKMFTTMQTNAMRAALASGTSGRNNLWSAANLIATDVNGTTTCAPIADMYALYGVTANVYTVCAGGSLTFVDVSYNAAVTSRTWAASGGAIIANPNNASTTIQFPTMGVQTVTLTSSNASGSSSAVKNVTVLNGVANYNVSYQESFEGVGLPANWAVINQTGGVTWSQNGGAASLGTKSYYINGTIDPAGAIDLLESPSYDFQANPGATYTFKYAYAQKNATNADKFVVQASSNCGGSWQDIYTPSNATMASGSGGVTATPFVPTAAQFKLYTLTSHPAFTSYKTMPNVKIRFKFTEDATAGFGNNIYLDEINFNTPLGVNQLTQSIGFNLYPNPSTGAASIEFNLSDKAEIKFSVIDIVGRVVEAERSYSVEPGSHIYTVNESQKLKSGVYFVNFEMNGQHISRKLIID